MSGGTEYAEALVRAEAEIERLRAALCQVRDLRANADMGITTLDVLARLREMAAAALGAASPAPRDGGENPPAVLADAALLLRRSDPEIASGLDALIRSWPAAPRDEDPVRRALIAMGERWHACNKGRAPSEAENERRKCARELLRFARALAPPSPPSGPERCVALDEYPRCSQPPVPGSNLCWAHGGDMFGKPPPSGPDSGSNEEG